MPSRHRYKCLNHNCPTYTDKNKSLTFVAMNSPMPTCPHCSCIKLEDCGEAMNIMGGLSANSQNSDSNFRRIADRYGLSDMNNKDGQAVKRSAPEPVGGATVSIGGYQVPLASAASGACAHMPGMSVPMKAAVGQGSSKPSSMMKGMTRVVAEHKGA
jgi:hypothetical protein